MAKLKNDFNPLFKGGEIDKKGKIAISVNLNASPCVIHGWKGFNKPRKGKKE